MNDKVVEAPAETITPPTETRHPVNPPSVGQFVTKDELPYYKLGDLEYPVSRKSMIETMTPIKQMDRATLEAYALALGFPVNPHVEKDQLELLLGSHVQCTWYEVVRGGVPPSVQAQHKERGAKYLRYVAEAENPELRKEVARKGVGTGKMKSTADKTGRPSTGGRTYFVCAEGEMLARFLAFGGQKALVVRAFKELKVPSTLGEIVARVQSFVNDKGEPLLVTRQPAERVVGFYLNEFRNATFIDIGELRRAGNPAPDVPADTPTDTPAEAPREPLEPAAEVPAAKDTPKAKDKSKKGGKA